MDFAHRRGGSVVCFWAGEVMLDDPAFNDAIDPGGILMYLDGVPLEYSFPTFPADYDEEDRLP